MATKHLQTFLADDSEIDALREALGMHGGGPSAQHCGVCGYGWGESYSRGDDGVMRPDRYHPDRPCRSCGRVGAVCQLPAGHDGQHELAE